MGFWISLVITLALGSLSLATPRFQALGEWLLVGAAVCSLVCIRLGLRWAHTASKGFPPIWRVPNGTYRWGSRVLLLGVVAVYAYMSPAVHRWYNAVDDPVPRQQAMQTSVKSTAAPETHQEAGSIRVKYSSSQVVQASDEPPSDGRDYNHTLNLDNIATLVLIRDDDAPPTYLSLERVKMVMPLEALRRVDTPFEKKAPPGSLQITSTTLIPGGVMFIFERSGPNRTHIVVVGARRFRVMLLNVRSEPTSSKDTVLYTYAFGISEE